MAHKENYTLVKVQDSLLKHLSATKEVVRHRMATGFAYVAAAVRDIGFVHGTNTHFSDARNMLRSETVFLKERNQIEQDAEGIRIACEDVLEDEFTLKQILSTEDPQELDRIYDKISMLENIHYNQLVSLDHVVVDGEPLPYESQKGMARFKLTKFFTIKKKRCIINSIKLNYEQLDSYLVADEEIRLEFIQSEIRQLAKEAFSLCSDDANLKKDFARRCCAIFDDSEEEVILPSRAPELYKEREDRKENPVNFIRRVYGSWLGKGLLRPHIKKLDLPLYQSLYRFGIPDDFDVVLPKATGRSPENISRSSLDLINSKRAASRRSMEKIRKKQKEDSQVRLPLRPQ